MDVWVLLLVFLCTFLAGEATPAEKLPFDPSIAAASAIAPATIMQEDLTAHATSLHPTAGYFTYSPEIDTAGSTASGHGFGGTLEATHSLNNHVGLGVIGFGYSGSGDYTPGDPNSQNTLVGTSGSSSVSGFEMGALLVLDPFSGTGFRLPFFIGLNYQRLSSSTPTAFITSTTLNSPGYTFGFSPRFSLGSFRIEPFMVITAPFENGQLTCSGQSQVCGQIPLQTLPIIGVNIIYRPLKLSFFFSASSLVVDTGGAYYSLGPSFRF